MLDAFNPYASLAKGVESPPDWFITTVMAQYPGVPGPLRAADVTFKLEILLLPNLQSFNWGLPILGNCATMQSCHIVRVA